jgi:hypothetical protein
MTTVDAHATTPQTPIDKIAGALAVSALAIRCCRVKL